MFGIILVATLVSAQIVFNLTDAVFTPKPKGAITLYEGNVSFDCGKTPMKVYVTSGDNVTDDDFEQVIGSVCTGKVTNVKDWNNRLYKQNEFGLRSFDEDILKKDVCNRNEQDYNKTSKECFSLDLSQVVLE